MTTDWLAFRAALVAAVESAMPASVRELAAVAWADGPRPHARYRVLLSVVSAVFEDRDSALSEGGTQRLESMAVITTQITAESVHDAGDADALWLVEQLRLGLRKVSVAAALEAAGVLVQRYPQSTRSIGGFADDRALSIHAIELVCCTTFALVPDPPEDAGLIEHVEVEGTVTDLGPDGDELDLVVTIDLDDPYPEP